MNLNRLIPVDLEHLQAEDSPLRAEILSELRGEKYDLVVNLNSHEFIGKLLPEINAARCIGFNSGDEYSENWLRFIMSFLKSRELSGFNLMDIYGWINKDYLPEPINQILIPQNPENIIVQLGTRNVKRQWSIKEFSALTDWLVQRGAKVFLTGTSQETAMSCELLNTCSAKFNIIDMTGKTSVPALFNLIENADLLISGDTGTMHIGGLYNIPSIALFLGPAFPHETLSDSAVVTYPDSKVYDCYPCKEQEGCPFDLKCRSFAAAKDIINYISGTQQENWFYPASDSAGQYLQPYAQTAPDEKSIIRAIYRYIAMTELLDCEPEAIELNKDSSAFENVKNSIERELKIFTHLIDSNTKDFKFLNSLNYLKPLYLNFLLDNNHSEFVSWAVNYLESILF